MDRQIEYPGQILTDTELLTIQRNAMVGQGWLSQAVLGTQTSVTGLACNPTSPASMSVTVGTGAIYALENLDNSNYGSLALDTTAAHQIVKQGLNLAVQTLSCPAPTSAGQSMVYLIQAAYQDLDTNSTVLQFFDSANPSVAFTGEGGTGGALNTTRQGLCVVQAKAGVAATTGSQTAPAVDSGFVPLYTVTVAYGQTTITAGSIAVAANSPVIPFTLPQLNFASLLSANGYQKLPGGFIVQWGQVTNSGTATVTVNFPIAFPNACLGVVNQAVPGTAGSASANLYYVGQVFSPTTTGFTSDVMINGDSNPVGQQSATPSFYIAIGF